MTQHIPDILLQPAPAPVPVPGAAGPGAAGAPAKSKPAASTQEYWDFGNADFMPQQVEVDYDFGELRRMDGRRRRRHKWMLSAMVLMLLAASYVGYDILINDQNPLDEWATKWTAMLDFFHGEDEDPAPVSAPPKEKVAKVEAKKLRPGDALKVVKGNPYWSLPNRLLGSGTALGRAWTPDEEETLRLGLEHHFRYQHFKAVRSIQTSKFTGSESLLWVALKDKGFWIRMNAAVTLAEFATEVPINALEGALTHARSDLIANFFERFVHRPNVGQLYLMRQIVRLLDEKGRLVVLRAISRSKDELRDLYMVAATQDPGRHIKSWITKALQERPIPPARRAALLAVVQGEGSPSIIFPNELKPASAAEQRKTRPASNVMSDDELEQQLDQLDDDSSHLQLFHDKTPGMPATSIKAIGDTPPAETFEYEK
jgi:hypothetical protein